MNAQISFERIVSVHAGVGDFHRAGGLDKILGAGGFGSGVVVERLGRFAGNGRDARSFDCGSRWSCGPPLRMMTEYGWVGELSGG